MKKLFFIASMFIASVTMAQSKYEEAMTKGLQMYKDAKTVEDFQGVSSYFERIGDAEKTQWLPFYYATSALYSTGWMDPKADKDKIAGRCNEILSKADALAKNADLYCMHQQLSVLQMLVDPQSRWQTYGAAASKALEDAKKADAGNPRIYYLEGMSVMNTPEAFGGGKAKAKVLFQKSLDLFKTFKPATPLDPNWGKEEAEKALASCQ